MAAGSAPDVAFGPGDDVDVEVHFHLQGARDHDIELIGHGAAVERVGIMVAVDFHMTRVVAQRGTDRASKNTGMAVIGMRGAAAFWARGKETWSGACRARRRERPWGTGERVPAGGLPSWSGKASGSCEPVSGNDAYARVETMLVCNPVDHERMIAVTIAGQPPALCAACHRLQRFHVSRCNANWKQWVCQNSIHGELIVLYYHDSAEISGLALGRGKASRGVSGLLQLLHFVSSASTV